MILLVDIGSNSIRTMTAERAESGFGFSPKSVFTTRLAQGLDETGLLAEASVSSSLAVFSEAKAYAASIGAVVYPYATSAVRDAKNRADFLLRARQALGAPVRILTGEEEACFALQGAASGADMLIEIGGGSAQIVTRACAYSAPIGCVRAKDFAQSFAQSADGLSPAALWAAQRKALADWVDARSPELYAFPSAACCAGAGGTITTLGALSLRLTQYDPARVSEAVLTPDSLAVLISDLYAMGDTRRNHPLLLARHDVILWGALVLLRLMKKLGAESLRVSDADGMEGYAMEILGSA